MIPYDGMPHLNALLNGLSAVLTLLGYYFIRRKMWRIHRGFMLCAVVTSTLFLISYLIYHSHAGSIHFRRQGWMRPAYFSILISHTILAAAVLPLVIITLRRALAGRFDGHKRIARWTLPIWFYVSVTGVLVYLMLYRL